VSRKYRNFYLIKALPQSLKILKLSAESFLDLINTRTLLILSWKKRSQKNLKWNAKNSEILWMKSYLLQTKSYKEFFLKMYLMYSFETLKLWSQINLMFTIYMKILIILSFKLFWSHWSSQSKTCLMVQI